MPHGGCATSRPATPTIPPKLLNSESARLRTHHRSGDASLGGSNTRTALLIVSAKRAATPPLPGLRVNRTSMSRFREAVVGHTHTNASLLVTATALAVPLLGEAEVAQELGVHLRQAQGAGSRGTRVSSLATFRACARTAIATYMWHIYVSTRSDAAQDDTTRAWGSGWVRATGMNRALRSAGAQMGRAQRKRVGESCAHPLHRAPLPLAQLHRLLDAVPVVLVALVVRSVVGRLGHGCCEHTSSAGKSVGAGWGMVASEQRWPRREHARGRQAR